MNKMLGKAAQGVYELGKDLKKWKTMYLKWKLSHFENETMHNGNKFYLFITSNRNTAT